jgi:arylsulfatase A-like enzyme
MCDDLGYGDVGFTGATAYATPHIDRIAREGLVLDQAYSSAPVCSPTRVALMTGRYPAREPAGLHEPLTTHPIGLPASPATLPRLLKDAGYRTALVGKWHLGTEPAYHPLEHGFDEFYGFLGAAVDYHSKSDTEFRLPLFQDGRTPVVPEGYLTDLLADRAARVIQAGGDAPLFLSLQFNAPHWPWQGPTDIALPDPADLRGGGSPERFAAIMTSLDAGVGRVLAALDAAGMTRDTLLVFTSDNGGERFSHMGPFSHAKMTVGEGGIRVATAVRWPARLAAGSRSAQVTATIDWPVTFAAVAGTTFARTVDGIDIAPALDGAAPIPRTLFWRVTQRRQQKAVRQGDLKYVENEEGAFLYDLASDVGERRDLARARPDDLGRLRGLLEAWEREVLPPAPLEARFR